MGELAVMEPRPNIAAGAKPMAIVPTDMDTAYRLAKAVVMAKMAPAGLETPEKAMIAIMHGLEIGLTPMAALQRIAVVNGRPTIWGDAAIGLVRASGLCEYIKESIEGDGDLMVATCESKRRGEPHPIITRFTASDAKAAGLWNKSGPWQQYKKRMMQMRARAFNLRDGYADVLGGLYLREEIEDEAQHRAPPRPPERVDTPADIQALEHKPRVEMTPTTSAETPGPEPAAPATSERRRAPRPPTREYQVETSPGNPSQQFMSLKETAPEPEKSGIEDKGAVSQKLHFDPEAARNRFANAAAQVQNREELAEAWERIVEPVRSEFFAPDLEIVQKIYDRRQWELDG